LPVMEPAGLAFVGPTPVPGLERVSSLFASHGVSSSTVQVRVSEAQGTSPIVLPTLVVSVLGSIVARKQIRQRRNAGRVQRCSSLSMRYPEQPAELALLAYACQQPQLCQHTSANFEQTEQLGQELSRQFSNTLSEIFEQVPSSSSQFTDDLEATVVRQISDCLEPAGAAIRQFSDHIEPVGERLRQFSDNFDPVGVSLVSRPITHAAGFHSIGAPSTTSIASGDFFKIAVDVVRDLNVDINDSLGPMETMQDIFSDVLLDIYTAV